MKLPTLEIVEERKGVVVWPCDEDTHKGEEPTVFLWRGNRGTGNKRQGYGRRILRREPSAQISKGGSTSLRKISGGKENLRGSPPKEGNPSGRVGKGGVLRLPQGC